MILNFPADNDQKSFYAFKDKVIWNYATMHNSTFIHVHLYEYDSIFQIIQTDLSNFCLEHNIIDHHDPSLS